MRDLLIDVPQAERPVSAATYLDLARTCADEQCQIAGRVRVGALCYVGPATVGLAGQQVAVRRYRVATQ